MSFAAQSETFQNIFEACGPPSHVARFPWSFRGDLAVAVHFRHAISLGLRRRLDWQGLEFWVVFKLMVFASARLVNLALPLAVLVASIMALGNLAEQNELTAMKASGMSFLRILRPLVVSMVLLCSGALWFSNTGWPAANIKFRALLYSVTKQKPAFNLREGVFYNGIDGFSIRVGTKHADGRLEDAGARPQGCQRTTRACGAS